MRAVTHRGMPIVCAETAVAAVFVGVHDRAALHVILNEARERTRILQTGQSLIAGGHEARPDFVEHTPLGLPVNERWR